MIFSLTMSMCEAAILGAANPAEPEHCRNRQLAPAVLDESPPSAVRTVETVGQNHVDLALSDKQLNVNSNDLSNDLVSDDKVETRSMEASSSSNPELDMNLKARYEVVDVSAADSMQDQQNLVSAVSQQANETEANESPKPTLFEEPLKEVILDDRTSSSEKIPIDQPSHDVESERLTDLQDYQPSFWPAVPQLIGAASNEFGNNCTKTCQWSDDGQLIAVGSEDARIRLFSTSQMVTLAGEAASVRTIKETEMIYDFAWRERDLLSTGRYQPIHFWNADSGELIGSYKCFNHLDEVTHAFSVCPIPGSSKFLCGLNNQVREFDLTRPGRQCTVRSTGSRKTGGQTGIISSISYSERAGLFACGSYSRCVGLYSVNDGRNLIHLFGHAGGVTQVAFSEDGNRVYSGARKDGSLICWDMRNVGSELFRVERAVNTNQRIQFTLYQGFLVSGGTDGTIRIWEETSGVPVAGYLLHPDCVNGVAVHPCNSYLATCSGQRKVFPPNFSREQYEEDDVIEIDSHQDDLSLVENSLKIWQLLGS